MKRPKHRISVLSVSRLPHRNEFLRKIRKLHPGFQELNVLEVYQDAVNTLSVALDLLFKCSLRIRPGNDVDVRPFSLAESSEVFH